MRRVTKSSGLWAYLERMGKIGASGAELIAIKKAYRKEYEKLYRREYRSKHKTYSICFNPAEAKRISVAARTWEMKEADFIKKAAFAYLNDNYVVQGKNKVDRILQTLLRYQTAMQRAEDGQKGSWFRSGGNFRELEKAILDMQKELREALMNPPKLTNLIKKALSENENFKSTILNLMAEHGSR